MTEESTGKLEAILKSVGKGVDAEKFAEEHESQYKSFREFFDAYIAEQGLDITAVISRSRISKNYVYDITNGVTKKPGRDKLIALCVAAGMDVDMVNRGLRIAGYNPLYPKKKRDVFIAECINRGATDITALNIMLNDRGEDPLDV